jgi:acetolactate synthase-1/2/3 large subunit
MKMSAADHVARSLLDNRIDRIFMVTGGDGMLWIALKKAGVTMVPARSEAAAVYMADGHARITGEPTVAFGQIGSGAAIMAGAMAEPWFSHAPVIALSTSVRTSRRHRSDHHEFDHARMFDAVTKWNVTVPQAERIGELIGSAVRMARSGCPRPVHLSIPRDYLRGDVEVATPTPASVGNSLAMPDPSAVEKGLGLIAQASRPVLLAGAGVLMAEAQHALRGLVEALPLPVATSTGGKGAFAEDHALALGVVGQHSRKVANAVVGEADLVLVLGSDLGGMVTNDRRLFAADATVIQVDVDPATLGATRHVDLPIHADVGCALRAFSDALEGGSTSFDHRPWIQAVEARIGGWWQDLARLEAREEIAGTVRHETILRHLRDRAADTDVLVSDTGYAEAWTAAAYPIRSAGRHYLRPAGTLGWAFPAAMGAQLARPRDRVVCFTGDGGLAYHIGNLETAVRLRIPTITVVVNNRSFAFEHHFQKYLFGEVVPEANDFADVDYASVARAHGAFGARVSSAAELAAALDQAYRQAGPSLIDVLVDKEALAPVDHYGDRVERFI